jgi:hypothetical protein
MRIHTVTAVLLVLAAVACSSPDRRRGASPAGPSAIVDATPMGVGGISGSMDVLFPSRADAFQFRNELEAKYQNGLNRSASFTFVDREGEVVWVQEYIRYRVNGCDHATAIARVMTQIDGGTPGGICAENRDFIIQFPPRDEVMDFRRQLESKYQALGRGAQASFVDPEGSVIWTQEYMRYRVNECDHAASVAKVFQQIDGGAVSDTCVPTCRYRVAPGVSRYDDLQHTGVVDLIAEPGGCAWTASSTAPWLTFDSAYNAGSNGLSIPYTVAQNVSGGDRTGRIVFTWPGGTTTFFVDQTGSPFISGFTMTDPFRSGTSPTTECHLSSSATPCTFTATSNLPGGAYVYSWTASYVYGGTVKTASQLGSSSTFTITDACGASDANATGNDADLEVAVTITDGSGNTQTIRSGQGQQPALRVKKFTC